MNPPSLPRAIVLTDGHLANPEAKTAHGLIRGTERYQIAGVVDPMFAGRDAGEVLDGKFRGIPVVDGLDSALRICGPVQYCIIGIATIGGVLPPHFLPFLKACLERGISLVNGLHDFLSEKPDLAALAEARGLQIIDIRKPKPRSALHFWTGDIFSLETPVVAVLGLDCAMGKRTTCRMIRDACQAQGMNAQMIYTGQTGWLQGGRYGFIFDSTVNDFISGELEHALLQCAGETRADLLLIEGQSALRNPSGPCGSEMLVSGNAKSVVLVVAPKRIYFEENPAWGPLPTIQSEMELIRFYGSQVIALALNTEHASFQEAKEWQGRLERDLGIPVLLPLEEGVDRLVPLLKNL